MPDLSPISGLFDCEDGTDNVTFSHSIVQNHHKSLLLGGGTKEANRDLGKMHFTLFGIHDAYALPATFRSADEVRKYVITEAGQSTLPR